MRRPAMLAVLLALALATAEARAETSTEPDRLVVLFTSDLQAPLVDPGCGTGSAPPLLPAIAAAVRAERRRAEGAPVVLLDAGDALFPSPLARQLSASPSTARALVEALRSAGFDAMAAGNTTVSAPARSLFGFARAARDAGLPLLAGNLSCDEEREGGCGGTLGGLTRREVLLERGALRIGVFSLLPEDLPTRVSRENVAGTAFGPPLEAARRAVLSLRQAGADLVVMLSHADRSDTAPRQTLELISRLAPEESPDLVVAAGTAGLAIRIRTAEGGPPVLAVSGEALGRAVLARRPGGRWELEETSRSRIGGPSDDLLDRVLGSWRAGYCAAESRALPGGELVEAMDRDDFLALLVQVAREQARAEVAIFNRSMISGRPFPVAGSLSPALVRRALPYDSELRVATVRGEKLVAMAPRLIAAKGLVLGGLTKREGTYYVNGRALDADARYRVVTNDFIAEGGDGALESPEGLGFAPVEAEDGATLLTERLLRWLGRRGPDQRLDPNERQDLHTRPLWFGSVGVDLSISDTHIQDTAGYDQPQLRRQELLDMRLGLEARGGMSTRDHSWENLVVLRYGRQRLETGVASGLHEWGESADHINVRSGYTMDRIRNHLLSGAWYGPSLFAEYTLESEFDHVGDGPHFLEMTGTGGLRVKPRAWLQVHAGAGVRSRVLEEDARAIPGLTFRAEVFRTRFLDHARAPVYLSGLVDYFVSWQGGGLAHKLITEGRIEIQMIGPLRLSASVRFFLYDEPGRPLASAVDSTLGVTLAMTHRLQVY